MSNLDGIGQVSKQSHEFDPGVTNLAKGFDGPLIVSAMRGDLQEYPDGKLSILIPVNGTEPSRRGAIVAELKRRNHNLVVLGVGRRPGERLFFGDTAAALLEKSERSLLFVAS